MKIRRGYQINEGDFVINIHSKRPIPMLVECRNGILGFQTKGWFTWMPIADRHVKVDI